MGSPKEYPCKCGCNQMTASEFVHGHRAPFEAQQKVQQEAERAALIENLVKGFTLSKPAEPPAEQTMAPPEESPGKPCLCGCGTLVKNRAQLARGHHWRWRRNAPKVSHETSDGGSSNPGKTAVFEAVNPGSTPGPPATERLGEPEHGTQGDPAAAVHRASETRPVSPLPDDYDGPPPWPAPVDQRRWSLAVDRPHTPKSNPWIKTKCHECLVVMWTRDPLSTWEHGGMCETCQYLISNKLGDYGRQQYQHQAQTLRDPFRPR